MEDNYIKVLKHLRDLMQKNKGLKYDEFKDLLMANKIFHNFDRLFNLMADGNLTFDQEYYNIGYEAYFKLLQYDELQQARDNSNEARKESKTALKWVKISFFTTILILVIQTILFICFH